MDPLNVATADAVRRAIRRAGETQSAVARHVGISSTSWTRRMGARTSFRVPELVRIARVLDIGLDELTDKAMEIVS
ncbi:helix-turn-helix domain-containing protein [Nocardia terpenica]|uniref:HTH cro/C1-type domain-containing protein n=1 Tax=Nocardia terpenica TaxID=455432 RepID=A0A164JWB3_9NOCA|nr:helix-turn-helix transcriptional regulator [Nocardia terpenica]KZM70785.1 hypothetical protein AWN90_40220 [Nocardia terpenica]NQE89947.1 helix-turn-helix transcriptional regulator [Nocardia terpenica]